MDPYISCKIVATQGKYDFKPYAYGFQKDSPFLPMFDYYINEMKEKGSLNQILAKYEPPPQICPDYRWEYFRTQSNIFYLLLCQNILNLDQYEIYNQRTLISKNKASMYL